MLVDVFRLVVVLFCVVGFVVFFVELFVIVGFVKRLVLVLEGVVDVVGVVVVVVVGVVVVVLG